MAKKRQPIPEFKRTSYLDASEGWPYRSQTLSDCVLEIFPDANPKRLGKWRADLSEVTDADALLFMAMVCGVYFRISRPDVTKALEDLWKWLTGGACYLDEELADIVIGVLAPQIARVIEARGYKRGWPKGEYVSKKGRPPASRGAWVAAFLAEKYLIDEGMKATPAKEQAADLASVLLGRRESGLPEFYRTSKKVPKSNIAELTGRLVEEYNHWVNKDKLRSSLEGQARNESLSSLLPYMGCERLCGAVLHGIPQDLWEPFWDIKFMKTGRSNPA
jgi:hypothetical protein